MFEKEKIKAQIELSEASRYFKKLKRETRLIRIGKKWHKRLKRESKERDITMSKLLDKICKHFFK